MQCMTRVAVAMIGMTLGGAHAADTVAVAPDRQDVLAFVMAEQRQYVLEQCLQRAPQTGAQLQAALQQWTADNAAAAARGSVAALTLIPDMGKDGAAQRASIRAHLARDLGPTIEADPAMACQRALNGIRFNVPLQMTGQTLTDPTLRTDIFARAYPVASATLGCTALESIDTEVTSDSGPGADRQVQERWTFKGCGKAQPLDVRYSPGNTGTPFVVSLPGGKATR